MGSNQGIKLTRAKKNVIKTLALMCACFVFCWSWNTVYFVAYIWGTEIDWNSPFYHFTVIAVFTNCFINPIVYAVKYDDFQNRVIDLFCGKLHTSNENEISATSRTSSTNM